MLQVFLLLLLYFVVRTLILFFCVGTCLCHCAMVCGNLPLSLCYDVWVLVAIVAAIIVLQCEYFCFPHLYSSQISGFDFTLIRKLLWSSGEGDEKIVMMAHTMNHPGMSFLILRFLKRILAQTHTRTNTHTNTRMHKYILTYTCTHIVILQQNIGARATHTHGDFSAKLCRNFRP